MYLTLFSAVLVVLCCLTLVCSAPLRGHELTRAVENAMSLAKKILGDIRGAHDACVTSAVSRRSFTGHIKA